MRAARIEEDIPLNPFTAGVYVATMMATVYVLKQKARRWCYAVSCIIDHAAAGHADAEYAEIGYSHANTMSRLKLGCKDRC